MSELKREASELKNEQSVQRLDIDEMDRSISKVHDGVRSCEDKIEKDERYWRRENLILYGVREAPDEDPRACKDTVVTLLNDHVPQRKWCDRDIVRAHRIGGKHPSTNRPLIVRFMHHDDKFLVLEMRETLKKIDISVANDLTATQRGELRELKEEGKRGYYKGGRLHIEEVPSTYATATSAKARGHATNNRRPLTRSGSRGGGGGRTSHSSPKHRE
ncbi:SH3 domain protein [Elysia marginata]|uniref:SH3 domain protein n=1 Tax=Elysia marginata TaxID=1093978 RepID=A0AAV4FWH4_9GAST|nr:SH3 domain protein [Elysia marginata]